MTNDGMSIAKAKYEDEQAEIRAAEKGGPLAPGLAELLKVADESEKVNKKPDEKVTHDAAAPSLSASDLPDHDEVVCRRCGSMRINPLTDLAPSKDECVRFRRHVLGEPRFMRTYGGLFGGRMEVRLRTRTVFENDWAAELHQQDLETMSDAWRLSRGREYIDDMRFRYMLAASLESVKVSSDVAESVRTFKSDQIVDAKSLRARSVEIIRAFPSATAYSILLASIRHFDQFCLLLSTKAAEPSFFEGTAAES